MKALAKKIVIVGGVAGGMSAAARARRLSEDSEIIVLEKSGFVSYANCGLPYFLGGDIADEKELILQTPQSLKGRFNIDVRLHNEVVEINPTTHMIEVKEVQTGRVYDESYDELILSVGASPIRPKLAGSELPGQFTLRGIEDVRAIEAWIESQQVERVVIVGGGFIGLEMAEQFVRRRMGVTVIDAQPQVIAQLDPGMAEYVHRELRRHGVRLVLGAPLAGIRPADEIETKEQFPRCGWVNAGSQPPIAADLIILGLGVRPDLTLARKAGLAIGELGGIKVNEFLQTNLPNIWAVGDAIEVKHPVSDTWALIPLGGPANRQGRMVADNIFGKGQSYAGTLGTAILRVFDLTAAVVGLNESRLKAAGLQYGVVNTHSANHAGYYPGAQRIDLKLLFHPKTGAILGAQAVGKEGVDKRIDVIATAMHGRMSVADLAQLELAYAPPFGSAKDPINLAGMAASDVLDGLVEQVQPEQLYSQSASLLLDVRSAAERQGGAIPNSVHIPLPELRARLSELPRDKEIIVHCQSGQRSYFACRMLALKGYAVKNLSGGYLTWSHCSECNSGSAANKTVALSGRPN